MTGDDPRRRLGTRHGELDVVAADRRHLVFCEVKTRVLSGPPGELGPFAAIGARKRRQVRLMAREWLARRDAEGPWPPELRFDAIGIAFDRSGRRRSGPGAGGAGRAPASAGYPSSASWL